MTSRPIQIQCVVKWYSCTLAKVVKTIFKPGARRPQNVGMRVCVCVSAPQAIKNYSREMKPE